MREAVDDLPHGLETLLAGEVFGGAELSGGLWQRLACSRAIYRRPELLILDEPTSQMDARGEHQIDAGRVCGHLELLKRHGFDDMAWCSHEVPCAGSPPSASASASGAPRRNSWRSSQRGPCPGLRADRRRVGGCRRRHRRAGREVGRRPPERVNITRQDHRLSRLQSTTRTEVLGLLLGFTDGFGSPGCVQLSLWWCRGSGDEGEGRGM